MLCKALSISHAPLGWRRTFLAHGGESCVLQQPNKNHSRVAPNTWHSRLCQFFGKKFRAAAMLSVFTVSAAVHEYVLSICFGFFYPVLFCLFTCFGGKFQGRERGSGCGVCGLFWRSMLCAFDNDASCSLSINTQYCCPRVAVVSPRFVNGFLQLSRYTPIYTQRIWKLGA